MVVRHGEIHELHGDDGRLPILQKALVGQKIHDIRDWSEHLKSHVDPWTENEDVLARQLRSYLPFPQLSET